MPQEPKVLPMSPVHLLPMSIVGLLKKAASGVPCLRRASFAEVATKAESGFAQAGRHFPVLTYDVYAPRAKIAAALLDGLF